MERSGKKSEEKSVIMKRAQELRKEGLSMSEAMKTAHKERKEGVIHQKNETTKNNKVSKNSVEERDFLAYKLTMVNNYKSELRKKIRHRINARMYDIKDGAVFLLSEPICPSCAELKSRLEIQKDIKSGKIILLEDDSTLKRYLEEELNIMRNPTFICYSSEHGFYVNDVWKDEQTVPIESDMRVAIVIDDNLKSIFSDLLDNYIQNGTVRLVTKRELPAELHNQVDPPMGYIDGKLYPVVMEDNAIIIERGDSGDDIEFEIKE